MKPTHLITLVSGLILAALAAIPAPVVIADEDDRKMEGEFSDPRKETDVDGDSIKVKGRSRGIPREYVVVVAAQAAKGREKSGKPQPSYPHGTFERNRRFEALVGGKKEPTWVYLYAVPEAFTERLEEWRKKSAAYRERFGTTKGGPGFAEIWSPEEAVLLAEVKVNFKSKGK